MRKTNTAPYQHWDAFNMPPKASGRYWIGEPGHGVGICPKKKPNWFHRFMMKLAFGITWKDE